MVRGSADPDTATFRFGDITVDRARRVVKRDGENLHLVGLTYELLILLMKDHPRVVGYEEIARKLWGNRPVSPETVRQRGKMLRAALGDDASKPRYVRVVHGQGLRLIPDIREVSPDRSARGRSRRLQITAVVTIAGFALLLAVALLLPWPTVDDGQVPRRLPPVPALAILPFANVSEAVEDEPFVGGFYSDLLTRLARLDGIRIVAGASLSDLSRDRPEAGDRLRQIGVSSLLTGTVQRAGDEIRVNARLVDARTEEQLWAENYDRKLTVGNLFDIQSEIARSVALELRAVLTPSAGAYFESRPTDDLQAYNHFLLGIDRLRALGNDGIHAEAAAEFRKAVERDPGFALAWAWLARSLSAVHFFNDDQTALEEARRALNRATVLDEHLPETRMARGYYLYHGRRDYAAALDAFDSALESMPGDASLHQAQGYVLARMGRFRASLRAFERAVRHDPRNTEILTNLAHGHARLRRYSEARSLYDTVIRIAPGAARAHVLRSYLELWEDGNAAAARQVLDAAPMALRAPLLRWEIGVFDADYAASLAAVAGADFVAVDNQRVYRPRDWYIAVAHWLGGDRAAATMHFSAAEQALFAVLAARPDDHRVMMTLADVYAFQGRAGDAERLARQSMSLMPPDMDATLAVELRLAAAFALITADRVDAGMVELENYLAGPGFWSSEAMLAHPRLRDVRQTRRFDRMLLAVRDRRNGR